MSTPGTLRDELSVSRLPSPARTISPAIRYHVKEVPSAPRSLRPEFPEEVEGIILKALEKDPDDRFASSQAVAAVLGT